MDLLYCVLFYMVNIGWEIEAKSGVEGNKMYDG